MPRTRKDDVPSPAKSKHEVRSDIITYIREERDTINKKWLALKESIKAEDRRKAQFLERKHLADTKSLPLNVVRFIGTLKKSVHHTMRYKGGTPYSIIRSLFLYWDADKSGLMSPDELLACMNSLGAKVTLDNCKEIVAYYIGNKGGDEMDYRELLMDIQLNEPTLLQFVAQSEEESRDKNELRFEEKGDDFTVMPYIVRKFVEGTQTYINKLLRTEGGTPEQHVRWLFKFFDYNFSGGLNVDDVLRACRRKLKLTVTREQAQTIVNFYDRKRNGDIDYNAFQADVCEDVKPIMQFTEMTHSARAAQHKKETDNPLLPVPFSAPKNRVLEKFKHDCKKALIFKVNKYGGSQASWVREAFVFYDPQYTRKMSSSEQLVGAAKRIGVTLTDEEARVLIACFDVHKTGEMHYEYLTKEIIQEGGSFLAEGKLVDDSMQPTARTPASVLNFERKAKRAVDAYVQKSKGKLVARDFFRGSFARYDKAHKGKVDYNVLKLVSTNLQVNVPDQDLVTMIQWFDTDGSKLLDYNTMTIQFYGGDDAGTDHLQLPSLREVSRSFANLKANGEDASTQYQSVASLPSLFGLDATILEKNMQVVESPAVRNARIQQNRNKIIAEKHRMERKLASINEQRKEIIGDYRHRKEKEKLVIEKAEKKKNRAAKMAAQAAAAGVSLPGAAPR